MNRARRVPALSLCNSVVGMRLVRRIGAEIDAEERQNGVTSR
jgi:hypothetical protein